MQHPSEMWFMARVFYLLVADLIGLRGIPDFIALPGSSADMTQLFASQFVNMFMTAGAMSVTA
ncbi:MAG: hypothetical protein RL758_498 [Pseudomonadota bacterium]